MEKLAKRIADLIGNSLGQDDEQKQVVAYGLSAILQFLAIFVISSVISLIGGFFLESMIMLFAVGLLKRSVGGAHSSTMLSCTIMSILNISIVAALAHYFFNSSSILIPASLVAAFIYITALFLVYKLAPVDSGNKPIVKPEKIKRLRRNSFLTLAVYILFSIALLLFANKNARLISMAVTFAFASGWQSFMLTRVGAVLIHAIDKLFDKEKTRT
ncbi:MAG: accessory gene regulator B family protein [Clostridiales bacterium]|nr:accessory gene regulator B family protein [Clostridiales bacterium]